MKCAECHCEIRLDTCYVGIDDNTVVCSEYCGIQHVLRTLGAQMFNEKFEKILTKEIS